MVIAPPDEAHLAAVFRGIERVRQIVQARCGVRPPLTRADLPLLQRAWDEGWLGREGADLEALGCAYGEVLRKELALRWVVVEYEDGSTPGLEGDRAPDGAQLLVQPVDMIRSRLARGAEVELEHHCDALAKLLAVRRAPPRPLGTPTGGSGNWRFARPSPELDELGPRLGALVEALRAGAGLQGAAAHGEHFHVNAGLDLSDLDAIGAADLLVRFAGERCVLVLAGSEVLELNKDGSRKTLLLETCERVAREIDGHLARCPAYAASFPVIDEDALDRLFPDAEAAAR